VKGEERELILLLLHPFNRLFSRKTWLSRYQKGNTSLDQNEARDGFWDGTGISRTICKQYICTSLQTDNHTNTSSLNFTGRMLFLKPNQQCQKALKR